LLAEALAAAGEHAGAVEHYQVALQLNPHVALWQLNLARTHQSQGQAAEARRVLQSLLARDPHHVQAQELLRTIQEPVP
jgi:predicted Zn-dependent protease